MMVAVEAHIFSKIILYFTSYKISVNSTLRVRLFLKIITYFSLIFTIILPASMFNRTEIRSVARCCNDCPLNVAMGGGFGCKRLVNFYCGPLQLQEKERRGFTFIIYNHNLALKNISVVKRSLLSIHRNKICHISTKIQSFVLIFRVQSYKVL